MNNSDLLDAPYVSVAKEREAAETAYRRAELLSKVSRVAREFDKTNKRNAEKGVCARTMRYAKAADLIDETVKESAETFLSYFVRHALDENRIPFFASEQQRCAAALKTDNLKLKT